MGIPRTLARRADTPPTVSKALAPLLAEALRRGEAARNVMEDALVDYGRWILVNIFGDDASAALDAKSENPLWVALLARAGGPTLRISRKVLYVAVEIAARDKRINDDIWRGLEPGRKELLLPLSDESKMRKAAKHVVEMKLSQDKTREYVAELRAVGGEEPRARMTVKRLASRARSFHTLVGSAAAMRSMKKAATEASDAEKAALRKELDAITSWLLETRKLLKG
ncbi:MAG: hypothetical protein HOO96_45085 [Polyangiaceae bacterium]|nr:hypothetical protein [Polyangiaceae bacterium]